jgi:ring-1,2-phenylacetyl-CoA epoxidase subunit PaaD
LVSGAAAIRAGGVCDADRLSSVWQALGSVEDPEIPAVSIVDLGLIRHVELKPDGRIDVGLTPTYVGCPATEVIEGAVRSALRAADIGSFTVTPVLSPAWSSDWITEVGRRKLQSYGIVPPERAPSRLPVACPHCHSLQTETVSEFGSTPCKALHRCRSCLEPFEYFKCI